MANVDYVSLTTREAFSGIFGSISLACWIFLLVPQLVENYRNGSAEAISLGFIFIWFLGDICNLVGAAWAGLVPVVIAIAVYFCFADGVLISQCLYYNIINRRRDAKAATAETDIADEEPLLARTRSGSLTIPGSRRRSSNASLRRRSSGQHSTDVLSKIMEEDESSGRLWLRNTISVLAIIAAGTAGWALAWQSGAWKPTPERQDNAEEPMAVGAQVLGYASAVAYLGARIPQIIKNWREKSCEGLSLLFFILSLMGNASYGAGILCHSTEKQYFMTNLPWLIGSLGTMVEDATIFAQFHIYSSNGGDSAVA